MKILVLNGSPKREKSDVMRLTSAFLEGMEAQAEILHTVDLHVEPCRGCFACWLNGGTCIQKDDMAMVLEKYTAAECVIWSFPLYCFSYPATMKAVIDRILPLCTGEQAVGEDGRTYHPRREGTVHPNVMISGCGFPNLKHNYEGVLFEFNMLFNGDFPRILCAESPLLGNPGAQPLVQNYLDAVRRAGAEYGKWGSISEETQKILDQPMVDPELYRKSCFAGVK